MTTIENKTDLTSRYYRAIYLLFILLGLYQVLARKDFIDGASSIGIALIFDPFNRTVSWDKRPMWQRAWLLIHLAVAAALLGYGIAIDKSL